MKVLEESNQQLVESNQQLVQKLDDLEVILPNRYVENVEKSSVKILNDSSNGVGVGFYISQNKVISCAHNFPSLTNFSVTEAQGKIFWCENFNRELISLEVIGLSSEADYDLIVFLASTESMFFLEVETPSSSMTRLAITSFGIGISKALDNVSIFSENHLVVPAMMLKVSDHHIVYSSNLFSGDSGGAVVCSSNGSVIAMHQETVNEAIEKKSEVVTLDDLNDSINSLLSGLSQGFVGLRLDTALVQSLISS